MDDDWGPIPLSRLSHAGFCLRRAALLTNEQIWEESADTAKGRAGRDLRCRYNECFRTKPTEKGC